MEFKQKALNAEDVAEMLEIGKNTVYALAKSGTLSSYRVGRKLRFTVEDVQSYIAQSRRGSGDIDPAIGRTWHEEGRSDWAPPVVGIGARASRSTTNSFLLGGADAALDGFATCLAEAGMPVLRSYQNSYQALVDLYFGYLDAAAVSLWDSSSDKHNLPYIKRMLPGVPVKVFSIATYTEGLLVQKGNPLGLRGWSDIIHSKAVLANREKGSTSRILLDEHLRLMEADPSNIIGYDREIPSALVQGTLIARKDADVGIGTEKTFHQIRDLDYLPLETEQLALVVVKKGAGDTRHRFMQSCLRSEAFRQTLASMVGYDFSYLGRCIYET